MSRARDVVEVVARALATRPEDVDVTAIRAESKDGVLTVHMPRMAVEKARPVTISVQ